MLPGYDLFDTPPPTEQAHNVARWTIRCPPGVETTFTVSQRHRVSRYEEVRKLSQHQIQQFFEDTYLDKQTFTVLNRLLSLYEQIERHEDALKEIEAERQKIYERQKQTQANLTPLGREGNEMKLRQRYVTLLNELEDRLNELLAAEKTANDAIRRLRKEIEQTIDDAAKGGK
jgi:seryl-tRNA synthetase